jgi:putative transposase
MRIPRCCQLQPNDVTHSIWRGHNKEWIFKGRDNKQAYLRMLAEECEESDVSIHSFCIMNNHDHNLSSNKTVKGYSRFYQRVHSRYARRYNDNEQRHGAVGNDRPKSLVVQNERHMMNAMFYVDANPIRARIVKHARHYRWSSHCYYANGEATDRQFITEPEWYKRLGGTAVDRQRAYRRLFDAYLRREGMLPKPGMAYGYYIGDVVWIFKRRCRHNTLLSQHRDPSVDSPQYLRGDTS